MRQDLARTRRTFVSQSTFALLLVAVLAALAAYPLQVNATARGLAIVANPSTPVDGLSLAELRKIFLGDRQFWNPSLRIVPLVLGPGARERELALRSIYGMSEIQFSQYWIAMI